MLRAFLFGVISGAGGAIAGFLIFVLLIRLNWFDGPGGGMAVFPLVLLPAIGLGIYGFARTLGKVRRQEADSRTN
jgi:hypothetical protein